MDEEERAKALDALLYIRSGTFNVTRPDSMIIAELIGVIRYLDDRLRAVEENCDQDYRKER